MNLLSDILEFNSNVEFFNFSEYLPNQNIEAEFSSFDQKKMIEKALSIRRLGFSFWESLVSIYTIDESAPIEFINKALHHNPSGRIISFSSSDQDKIIDFISANNDKNISLRSNVGISNGLDLHIPMIDFHITPGKHSEKIIETIIYTLGINPGYLINSGKSYHYLSTFLLPKEKLMNILVKLILLSPIVDRNWLVHQILEGSCSLRMTKANKIDLDLVRKIQ
ncbi:hypothetical protein [Leptospira licerasiae]|uniref:primase 1D-like protein n=1 Tax=Leptospira licerasiae TaxID=447106 RepID=UPI0030171D08